MHTEAHLFSVPNDYLWYDKLWGPSQRVVTLFKSSVDDHLAIYSLDIWPLSSKHIYSPDVHIHSFTQPVFIRHADLPQHLSLVALSGCSVPQLRCPSAGI